MSKTTKETWYNINVIQYVLVSTEIGYVYYDSSSTRPASKTVFLKENGVRELLKSEKLVESTFLHFDEDAPDKILINIDKVFRITDSDRPGFVEVFFISGTYFTVPEETGQKIRERLENEL